MLRELNDPQALIMIPNELGGMTDLQLVDLVEDHYPERDNAVWLRG